MALKYLLGPVSADWAARYWGGPRERGECLAFNAAGDADVRVGPGDSWADVEARLPEGWRPDAVFLYLAYATVPQAPWSSPVPLVGLAADWNLLWHGYRLLLPRCERVLTDAPGVEVMRRCGWAHARAANLYGPESALLGLPPNGPERDIDVLFVGNLSAAVQRERLPWLARLARLAGRRRVAVRTGLWGDAYRDVLLRSRIVFNRSVRGECNRRAFEAACCGALLFQERGNAETAAVFRGGEECVCYGDDDLEELLEYYLTHEDERGALAAAAHARVQGLGFEVLWADALRGLEAEWPEVCAAAARRPRPDAEAALLARTWQALGCDGPTDPTLDADLDAALAGLPHSPSLHHARGLVAGLAARAGGPAASASVAQAARCFRRALACDSDDAVAGLSLVEALAAAGHRDLAAEGARRTLTLLGRGGGLPPRVLDAAPFPPGFDFLRVEWERAAWENAGRPDAEARAKADLLRWRLHALLAALTGELAHHREAALARPDLPPSLAALGCALGRAGKAAEAVPHLRRAMEANPFDGPAARALAQALRDAGDAEGERRLAEDRRLLRRAAPQAVPEEAWFAGAAPAPAAPEDGGLASIIILCCNEVEYTRLCLESVLRRTRPPYELILVDNGSADGTPAYLEEVRARPGPARVEVVRNETNVGFPAGCNQGLARSQGRWVVFLNNDTVVPEGWLEGLIAWAARDPSVGMVGAVTNYSRPPQQVAVEYGGLEGMEAFAARRRREYAGKALSAERLAGFCLLTRRDVLEKVGGFDERYGLGFFDDDDLSVKVLRAGHKLVVALDVFVHHFGSRTFAALKVDCPARLEDNLRLFREKWGEAEAAGYRLPAPAARPNGAPPPAAGQSRRMRVSLCMIVKDEEANLPACLGSAADLVDEIVVVDTGSTDGTKEVALRSGAKLHEFAWCDDFAAARNETLRHATGDYIFWLDADDRLDGESQAKLKALFASLRDENVAYAMKCLCLPDRATGTATVVDHVRLFRNRPEVRWSYRVHEQILPAVRKAGGEVRWSDVTVHHSGYQDPALRSRKLERDLRLLQLEDADRPDDPFTLFNLGSVHHELGRPAEALPRLRRSLAKSHPRDSIVRKLYALIAGCHRLQNQLPEALAACQEGRGVYPDDPELLFLEGLLRRERGDLAGAEACLLQVLNAKPGPHFASVDAGLRGYKARHNLAVVYHQQGRARDAGAQWRLVTAERPDFLPGWLGLGETALRQGGWALLDEAAERLDGLPGAGPLEAALLRGRGLLARREFAAARSALEAEAARFPNEPAPRVVLTHVLLQEGKDPDAAERALRDVLALDPNHAEARHNLGLLLARRDGHAAAAVFAGGLALAHLYEAACRTPSDINEHLPTLYGLAKECRHVTEFGTRTGVSTTALLHARPRKLVCYDRVRFPQVDALARAADGTEFVFRREDVLTADIEETDLLFIDTLHDYDQLREELRRHAARARRYIVLHDTTTFGERGETPGRRGLWPAVEEFLAQGTFRLKARHENNNGLTVLEAVGAAEADRPLVVEASPAADAAVADAALAGPGAGAASPAAPPVRPAVVTIAHDEEELIGPFLDHYLAHGADAVFVVDNDCTDLTAEVARRRPNVVVERLESGELDEELRTATFQRLREACAGRFDWVILVDCDEFLVPKEGSTIKEALARHAGASALGTDGWEAVQRPGEPAIDWSAPLPPQRRFGVPNRAYDKPVVLRPGGPERLAPGQHYLLGDRPWPDVRPFWLLHLAACDERLFFKRRLRMTARQGLRNIQKGLSSEHTAQTEADVRRRWKAMQQDPRLAPLPAGSS